MTREAEVTLSNILYERHDFKSGSYYEVFWYHWPRDGILPWEDYEPVVFAYNQKHKPCFVLVRRAWRYSIANPEDVSWPPEILFKGGSHHQFVRMTTDYFGDFDESKLRSYMTVNVPSPKVASVQRTGPFSIPSWNIGGVGENIYRKVEKILAESCET
jgi:hypothetical protein